MLQHKIKSLKKEGCVLFFGSRYSTRKEVEPGVVFINLMEHLIPP